MNWGVEILGEGMGNRMTRRRAAIDERHTRPQGLYPCRDVDHRKLRRLILDAKLAPCHPGADDPAPHLDECPICFLNYPSLNRSKCCTKGICTECFLQLKAPHATRPTPCPFCKSPVYAVAYRGAKTLEEKGLEQAEEQRVIEAKIRMRQQELQDQEKRGKRREEDIRLGRIRAQAPRAHHPTSITPIDDRSWRSGWSNAGHQDQIGGGLGITAPLQQSAVSTSSNFMNQQQTEIEFPTPRYRVEGFDLDLEDVMVMEAIWLSLQAAFLPSMYQEQGACQRLSVTEAIRASEPLTEITEANATQGLASAIAALAIRGSTAPITMVDERTGEVLANGGDEPSRPPQLSQRAEEPETWASTSGREEEEAEVTSESIPPENQNIQTSANDGKVLLVRDKFEDSGILTQTCTYPIQV